MRLSAPLLRPHGEAFGKSSFAMILGFVPVILFALLATVSQDLGLWAAFAAAFTLTIRDFAQEQLVRLLDAGSMLLFGLLALYVGFIQPGVSTEMTRLMVDAGFFVLALASIILRNPVTLQYAREQVPREAWQSRRFLLTNYGLTAFWMLAFAMMCAADALANIHKDLPPSFDAAISLFVLVVAVGWTARYPFHLRDRAARESGASALASAVPAPVHSSSPNQQGALRR
jgi:hypothetical protein